MDAHISRETSTVDPGRRSGGITWLRTDQLLPSAFSVSTYGEPVEGLEQLTESIQQHGILVPLTVTKAAQEGAWEILSGHRRWACARNLQIARVPCEVRSVRSVDAYQRLVLAYNRQRQKTFSQLMREADALQKLYAADARQRRLANLRAGRSIRAQSPNPVAGVDCRNSDARGLVRAEATGADKDQRAGRTDVAVARQLGIGGKDVYRQARAVWQRACQGDPRAQSSVKQLDAGTKTVYAAYKDLRRRDRFTTGFRPTPYDVWPFRRDSAFGLPHPGATPAGIVAHTLYYFTTPGALVVDPMAGGGTTLDVCHAMGRRCLSYDLESVRPEIQQYNIRHGFPAACQGCDLIFCDPPYHTMLARSYAAGSVAEMPLREWVEFLHQFAADAFSTLLPGGYLALLLAPQTEKDLPAGYGYLDHVFFSYMAAVRAGFFPERRISCPMEGAYLPQDVRRARKEGRLLGQVRDLLVVRKPTSVQAPVTGIIPSMQIDETAAAFLPVPCQQAQGFLVH